MLHYDGKKYVGVKLGVLPVLPFCLLDKGRENYFLIFCGGEIEEFAFNRRHVGVNFNTSACHILCVKIIDSENKMDEPFCQILG